MQHKMPNGLQRWSATHDADPHASMTHAEDSGDDTVETCKMTAACAVIAVVLVLGAILAVGYVMPLIVS